MAGIFDTVGNKLNNLGFAGNMGLLTAGSTLLEGGGLGKAAGQGLDAYQRFNQMSEEEKRKAAVQKLIAEGNFTDQEKALLTASKNPIPLAVQIKNQKATANKPNTFQQRRDVGTREGLVGKELRDFILTGDLPKPFQNKVTTLSSADVTANNLDPQFVWQVDSLGKFFKFDGKPGDANTIFGMDAEMYKDLSAEGKKIVDTLGLQGIQYGTSAFQEASKAAKTGWQILDKDSEQFKTILEQGDMDALPPGQVVMSKNGEIKVINLKPSTGVTVNNFSDEAVKAAIKNAAKNDKQLVIGDDGQPETDENGVFKTVPIPGGAADLANKAKVDEELAAKKRDFRKAQTKEIETNTILKSTGSILDILAPVDSETGQRVPKEKGIMQRIFTLDPPEVGGFGAMLANPENDSMFFSQEAKNIALLLKPIQAVIGFGRLQRMRDESKTGGALGNVSDSEIRLLYNSMEALDQGLSPDQLIPNLQNIERIYGKILNDPIANSLLEAKDDAEFERLLGQLDQGQIPSGVSVDFSKMSLQALVDMLPTMTPDDPKLSEYLDALKKARGL
tara:strand:- start:69 stop:1751 length:1683 start_codon:yes stop_codon:yes gene_type:complete